MKTISKLPSRTPFKFLIFFVMFYITIDLASNVVVYDIVRFGSYTITAAMLIFPVSYLIADIITEIYGYSLMRQVIWGDLICNVLFSLLVSGVVHLPSQNSQMAYVYQFTLGHLAYIGFGALIGGVVSEFTNAYVLSKLKIVMLGRHFWLRSISSTALGMAVLLIIANSIAFFGMMDFNSYLKISIATYMFGVISIILLALPATIIVNLLKRSENYSVDDSTLSFNPFKISEQ